MKIVVPIALKRKLANPTLLACRFNLEEASRAVILEPKLAPKIIGMATSIGIRPPWASITIIPEVTELECIIPVKRALIKYASMGLENSERKAIISWLFFKGSIYEESRESAKSINPRKKSGLPNILDFLLRIVSKNPTIINTEAKSVELINAN